MYYVGVLFFFCKQPSKTWFKAGMDSFILILILKHILFIFEKVLNCYVTGRISKGTFYSYVLLSRFNI